MLRLKLSFLRLPTLLSLKKLDNERDRLPDSVKSILEEGLNLYQLHQRRHGRSEFLDYTARTGLDMLAKHYHQAASAWVVFFVPGSDGDIGFYNEFMHYLEEKRRAAVVKLDERTTLFLVPPSEFSEKVLKVPGKLSISGVILRLEHSGSNLRSSLQHPNEKIDTNFMPYHGDTPLGPFTPLPPFPNMGKSGVNNLSFLGNLSTAASPASLSGSAHAIGSTSNPANENRHDYMLHQQNPTFVPNWSPQNLQNSNSGTGSI